MSSYVRIMMSSEFRKCDLCLDGLQVLNCVFISSLLSDRMNEFLIMSWLYVVSCVNF
ncbi:hypothetical protein Hdeb2414_s0010g00341751 [Helianthus debilis subsp. tardiflorus]